MALGSMSARTSNVPSPKEKALFRAIENGNAKKIRQLLTEGVNANAAQSDDYRGNYTALMLAAAYKDPEAIELLLKAGADPRASSTPGTGGDGGETALTEALFDVTRDQNSLRNGLRVIETLLKAGSDPYARKGFKTPFWRAAESGSVAVVDVFLKAGASPIIVPDGSHPPLHGAAMGSETPLEIAKLLVASGSPVDAKTPAGNTPLMAAAYTGKVDFVKFFLEQGADVNAVEKNGRTPLIHAACYANESVLPEFDDKALQIVKLLLQAGADISARDTRGLTASDYAEPADRPVVFKHLKQFQ